MPATPAAGHHQQSPSVTVLFKFCFCFFFFFTHKTKLHEFLNVISVNLKLTSRRINSHENPIAAWSKIYNTYIIQIKKKILNKSSIMPYPNSKNLNKYGIIYQQISTVNSLVNMVGIEDLLNMIMDTFHKNKETIIFLQYK